MNTDFRVLWLEDTKEWLKPALRRAESYIVEHKLTPIIHNKKGNEGDLDDYLFGNYDLILMDYKLVKITGNVLISKLREHEIYVDVLFYSAQFAEMLQSMYRELLGEDTFYPPLDGVYYSERKDTLFYDKLKRVIDKIVRREQDVINLRGVVLDNTSVFDNRMNSILSIAWQRLREDEKTRVTKYVSHDVISEAKAYYIEKMDELLTQECCFSATVASQDYLIDSRRKAGIFGRVVSELIKHHDLVIDDKYKRFADNYYKDIIRYRNALGHAQTNPYGDRSVYVGKIDGEPIEFNEELCRQLRASIQEYDTIFDKITEFLV